MRFQFGAPTPATLKERKLPKNRLEPIVRFIRGLGFHGRHPGDLAFHPPLLCFVSKLILTPCVSGVNRTSPLRIKVHALFIFERLRSGNVYQSHVTVEGGHFPHRHRTADHQETGKADHQNGGEVGDRVDHGEGDAVPAGRLQRLVQKMGVVMVSHRDFPSEAKEPPGKRMPF